MISGAFQSDLRDPKCWHNSYIIMRIIFMKKKFQNLQSVFEMLPLYYPDISETVQGRVKFGMVWNITLVTHIMAYRKSTSVPRSPAQNVLWILTINFATNKIFWIAPIINVIKVPSTIISKCVENEICDNKLYQMCWKSYLW